MKMSSHTIQRTQYHVTKRIWYQDTETPGKGRAYLVM